MSDIQLLLGPVAFRSFEMPERLEFGGCQRLAVHTLPGGRRIVDAMGRDDADLAWSGTFSGPDAADRVRALDALRVAGEALPVTWDSFFYTVLIRRLEANYSSPWWIPYRIVCTVLRDEASSFVEEAVSVGVSVLGDLATAAGYTDVSLAQTALGQDGATIRGTPAYAAALTTLGSARDGIEAGLAGAAAQITSSDLPTALAAAGTLAALSAARGYVGRAAINLTNASS